MGPKFYPVPPPSRLPPPSTNNFLCNVTQAVQGRRSHFIQGGLYGGEGGKIGGDTAVLDHFDTEKNVLGKRKKGQRERLLIGTYLKRETKKSIMLPFQPT